ncbi:MAG: thioesterase [Cellvibrionaceae bacterium]|nr:thioesterase [Cellvibrionaceae bacterium]|tara:strand:- start:6458 stop:7021 length:564 start_codon:yes stop_codon:yes gene_type:complete
MNLYFRMIRILLRQLWQAKMPSITDTRKIQFRVWPFDCDPNLHLTNSRFIALIDVCRFDFLLGTGLKLGIIKNRYSIIVNSLEITFIREIPPFRKFSVQTKFMGWDEKYYYFESRFFYDGKLCAYANSRQAIVKNRKIVPFGEVLANAGYNIPNPRGNPVIESWRKFMGAKKNHETKPNDTIGRQAA